MTTVQTLHPVPTPSNIRTDLDSPTTPRIHHSINHHHHHHHPHHIQHQSLKKEEDAGRTPTMSSFAEANGKRALPLSPPPAAHATIVKQISETTSEDGKRPVSQRSNRSLDSNDLHETEHSHTSPDNDGSDGESVDGDTGRPTKKKKGQRFFCTDYPPCNLSFTRSEHLARHIRKHTGERPFQCHCNRRFSRLDNLRQHAQTVHVNEEIPTDSLAATGTRFQRQIRTDRVRPAGARARASTTSSATSHGRGHSRNLSTSSITSIASTASNVSTISSISQDHRFHPLVMAPEQRPPPSLSIDTHRGSSQYGYAPSASGGPTTPTSTSYATQPASPYSTMTSPVASSRFPSYEGSSRHARRLSVPNGHSPYHQGYPQAPASPSGQSYIMSNGASTVQSPTSSVFSNRQEMTATEADIRRRTWHPSTYSGYNYQRPATSGLSYSQTPDAPQPSVAPQATAAAAGQTVTLPGFKDLVNTITTGRPSTPPAQVSGHQPPAVESPNRPLAMTGTPSERSAVNSGPPDRPAHRSWDVSLHQNLNKLDIASGTPPRDMAWVQQTISDINQAAASVHGSPQHLHPPAQVHQPVHPGGHPQQQQQQQPPLLGPPIHTSQAPTSQPMDVEPSSPSRDRRQGWYQGPIAPASQITVAQHQRISPASSISEGVPTPNNPSFEHHPSIMHASGYVEGPRPQQHQQHHQQQQQGYPNPGYPVTPASKAGEPAQAPLSGLDALVAAATSESHNRDARR